MSLIAGAVLAQKLLPPRAAVDVPLTLALAIVGLGILIVLTPTSVQGIGPPMQDAAHHRATTEPS